MKRLLAIFLVITSLLFMLPVSAADSPEKPIEVYYLGEKLEFSVPPQLIENTTMVPMRGIFEALGYYITWDGDTRTVYAGKDYTTITITIGETQAYINDEAQQIAAPAVLINGSTLVPLRFIGEASGYVVAWHEDRTITIDYSEQMKGALAEKQQGYIEDLKMIKSDLPALHRNLFFYKSRESFNSEMDSLIAAVPSLSDLEMKYQLLKIINSVNDTHTALSLDRRAGYPFVFFQFSDGVYLIDAPGNYRDMVGKRLTAIQGVPVDEVIKKLSPITPFDNEAWAKYQVCGYLSNATYLTMVGVLKSERDKATYSFGGKTITALDSNSYQAMTSQLEDIPIVYPASYESMPSNYWCTALPEKKAVYAKYSRCYELPDYTFADFTKDIFKEVSSGAANTLILDMRDNTGGNSEVINPLITEIMKNSKINRLGHLYVIVGRKTFSSGILNTMKLKKQTYATFVGEPTGGSPNHYGWPKSFDLPNIGATVSYSSQYYRTMPEEVHTFTPNIVVPLKAASFFSGKDDFLEAVFADMAKH